MHALVTSRLDNCNAVLFGLPDYLIKRLPYVFNAAARLVSLTNKYDHITPVMMQLLWLPVKERINFKIIMTTFKALHGINHYTFASSLVLISQGERSGHLTSYC